MPRRGENIRKRKDGRWEARYIKDRAPDGKAEYGYLYGKTYAEVKQKKLTAVNGVKNSSILPFEKTMLLATIMDEWLHSIEPQIKQSSYTNYLTIVENHLKPSIGGYRIHSLQRRDIEKYTTQKLITGRIDKQGGLSAKTVTDQLAVLRLVLRYAEDNGWCGALQFRSPKQIKPEIEVLSAQDQKTLEQNISCNADGLHVGVLLSLYTGLRIGEVCALRFSDIDVKEATLFVRHTIMRIKETDPLSKAKTKIIIDTPKTKASLRDIPLPSFLLKKLSELSMSAANKDAYVLTGQSSYIEPRSYYRKYKGWLYECGLEKYTYHALRHTFATRCIEHGFDIKSLSEILGHASVRITLERYVHSSMDLKRSQMEKLSAAY